MTRDDRDKKPDPKSLRPINLYEAKMIEPSEVDVVSASIPRYIVVYAHLDEDQAKAVMEYLRQRLAVEVYGTVTLPFYGRMI